MTNLLALLGGWKGYVLAGAVSAVLAAGASSYLTAQGYRLTIAGLERDRAKTALTATNAALAQFTADTDRLHDAAQGFASMQDRLGRRFDTLSKDLQHVVQSHPLPADCAPDAGRLRALTAAVAEANAAAGYGAGPALRQDP